MRTDLPAGTLTLILTDIEGSTRLLNRLGAEGYAQAQADHRTLLRKAFADHGGVEVDTQGDAFFYVFPTVIGGLRGAVAAQRALAHFEWPPGATVKVRMGMHTGEPQRTEEGYVGMTVNTTARISSAGHGGQVLMSEHTADLLEKELAGDEITLRDLGEFRLKDLDEPQRIHQIVIPELPSDFPAPRSVETRPNNLPVPLTPFVGRARLVVQVRDLVLEPSVRAVTLLGPGGTGKSRLALRVASELLPKMGDGAWFVGLAAVHDPELVTSQIAASLGLKEEGGKPLIDTICEYLLERELLLVIDNFEQVQAAARTVADIMRRCPRVKMLVTSRQPLRISGERGVRVPPLALPEPGQLPPLPKIAEFEAVRLFVDRAQSAQFDFELTEGNAATVVEICRRVDALPLAIELATARLYEMDVAQLLAALDKRMAVLTEGAVDLLDHQRTLKDLVAWSYDLLEPDEQRLWRRLAVFSGGCFLDAAEAVCDTDDEYELEQDAPALAMKSLLSVEFVGGTSADQVTGGMKSEQRISMLETLREYAVEKLAESGDATLLQGRHAEWFTGVAEAAETELRGPRVDAIARRLDADLANFRIALKRSLDQAAHVDLALRTGAALWFYFYQRGFLSEARNWLESALDAKASVDPAIKARALLALANLERHLQAAAKARSHAEEALTVYRELGDKGGIATALGQLGMVAQYVDDFDAAAAYLEEAVPLLRELDNLERLTVTLVALGGLRQLQGDLVAAEAHLADSLHIARDLNDPHHIATALVNLGEVEQLKGETQAAAQHLRESLVVYHDLGLKNCIAYCLEMLAAIDNTEGRPGEAAQLFGAADRLREEIGVPVESFNRARYDQDLGAVRQALGTDFESHWNSGRVLDTARAVGIAMHDATA